MSTLQLLFTYFNIPSIHNNLYTQTVTIAIYYLDVLKYSDFWLNILLYFNEYLQNMKIYIYRSISKKSNIPLVTNIAGEYM